MEFVQIKEPGIKLPYAVVKDRVGDISIKLQFGSEGVWTRALRHVSWTDIMYQFAHQFG